MKFKIKKKIVIAKKGKKPLKKASSSGKESMLSKRIKQDLTPSEQMKQSHEAWVKDVFAQFGDVYYISLQDSIDRIDITDTHKDFSKWRLCVVGLTEGDVDATLFFKQRPNKMTTSISFLNIPGKDAAHVVGDLLTMQRTYSF